MLSPMSKEITHLVQEVQHHLALHSRSLPSVSFFTQLHKYEIIIVRSVRNRLGKYAKPLSFVCDRTY